MNDLIEKAKQIKIIFFDIDDTLRAKTTAYMPESINEVFAKLRAKGILTGIATGRNLLGVVPEVRALNPDFFVTINGAYVENGQHEGIYKYPLDKALITEIIDWLDKAGSAYSFIGSEEVVVSDWNAVAIESIGPIYHELPEDKDYYQRQDVYQLLTYSEHDDQLVIPSNLTEKIRMVRWHPKASDIVPIHGSKADGVQKVLEVLGLTPANMMNFGDGPNDSELFDLAGLSVAMKASYPEILAKADYVTDTIENDGILQALQKLQLID